MCKKILAILCLIALALSLCAAAWAEGFGLIEAIIIEKTPAPYAPGDILSFGHYEQDGDPANGQEPIEWRVLEVRDDRAVLISEYALDAVPYNELIDGVTWETCSLRKWLNGDFLSSAFTMDEQVRLVKANVTADANPYFTTKPGNDTQDWVYALSVEEVQRYFADWPDRMCAPTAYAKEQGVWADGNGVCWWWLRTPGRYSILSVYVDSDGSANCQGHYVDLGNVAVRPVIALRLS